MKNKLFLCYRPLVLENESESKPRNSLDDRMFSKVTVAKSPPSDQETLKRSKSERSVSGIFRAALFEISLKKKARKRRLPQLRLGSESDESKDRNSFSSFSSSYSSSLPSPTQKSSSDSESDCQTEPISPKHKTSQNKNREEVDSSGSRLGFLLITLALFVTVFYGRPLAVMFTCLCLYSLPRRNIGQGKSFILPAPETEPLTGKYRKRVIMEGMLERNYQRRGH